MDLPRTFRFQETPVWCGPAAVQVALSVVGITATQAELAAELGTTDEGTDTIADVVRVLNARIGPGAFASRFIATGAASPINVGELRVALGDAVARRYALVANVVGSILGNDGRVRTYDGGHYVALTGFSGDHDEVLVSDVAGGEFRATAPRVADWIALRGYAFITPSAPAIGDDMSTRDVLLILKGVTVDGYAANDGDPIIAEHVPGSDVAAQFARLSAIVTAQAAADEVRDRLTLAALTAAGGSPDAAPILAAINVVRDEARAEFAALHDQLGERDAEIDRLRTVLALQADALADALKADQ